MQKLTRWLAAATLLLCTSLATAQPSATDRAAAEALFDQALALMESGAPEQACPKLEQSQRLDPGVGTLLYLAACYEASGRTASAWGTFLQASYAAADAGDERQSVAAENAARLKPQLSYLVLVVAASETPGLAVTNDGQDVARALWGSELPIDPGVHQLEASAEGKQSWSGSIEVPAKPGVVNFEIPELADAAPAAEAATPTEAPPDQAPPPPAEPATPRDPGPSSSSQSTWGWVAVAGGSALVVGGGALAFLAMSDDSEADAACRRDDPSLCSDEGLDLSNSASSKANWAGVLGGIGGAALATGLVLVFTAPDDTETARLKLKPQVAAHGGGLHVGGTF